jgi:alpha-ketoglutarate-dependent taurine dioxygenase
MTTTDTPLATTDSAAFLKAKRVRIDRFNVSVGPVGHLAAERERLNALTWNSFTIQRLGATVGAELAGIDLSAALTDEVVDEVRQALYAYKVIFFRDQPLTSAQQVAFAKRFGELEIHPFIPGNDEQPELVRFAKSAEVAGYENLFHHDVTWRTVPSMGAVLRAVQVPVCGGDTLFSDMYAAYDGLDDELKERIDGLTAVHDFMRTFGRRVPPEKFDEVRARYPQVEHPVVCTHPGTGRNYLYVNRNFTDHIVGLDEQESTALIDVLARHAETIEYQCRFQWRDNSIAFWDNRAVQHYASSDYWPDVRIMERASIVGTRPARAR